MKKKEKREQKKKKKKKKTPQKMSFFFLFGSSIYLSVFASSDTVDGGRHIYIQSHSQIKFHSILSFNWISAAILSRQIKFQLSVPGWF